MSDREPPSDAAVELMCPCCHGAFGVLFSMSGSAVHCPHCDETVTVPPVEQLQELAAPPRVAPSATDSEPEAPPVQPSGPPVTTDFDVPATEEPRVPPSRIEPRADTHSPETTAAIPKPPPATTAEVVDAPPKPAKIVTAVTEDGDTVAFRARGKVIQTSRGEVELKDRSREEKSKRRGIRNLILIILCLAALFGLPAYLLSRKPPVNPPVAPTTPGETPSSGESPNEEEP